MLIRVPTTRVLVPSAVAVATVALAALRIAGQRRFFYMDDTQLGAAGQWYAFGKWLLAGEWRFLSPQAWQAGNYLAEGQWGLFNPVTMLIAVATVLFPETALLSSVIKIACLALLALGVYALARSFDAERGWAAVAGLAAPLVGFTIYIDASSWVTGLFNAALLPWAWWGLRGVVIRESRRGGFAVFLISAYLIVTFGYVYGVLALAMILIAQLVEAVRSREWRLVRLLFALAAIPGLLAITVYLPGVLTAPVTGRTDVGAFNDFSLNADLSDLGSVTTPLATTSISAFWGLFPSSPIQYIAWFLPLAALALPLRASGWRGLGSVVAFGLLNAVFVVGPSYLGPIRWPARVLPFVALAALLLFAVVMSRGALSQKRGRYLGVTGLYAFLAWLSYSQNPEQQNLSVVATLAVQLAVVWAIFLVRRRDRLSATTRSAVPLLLAGTTAALAIAQIVVFPVSAMPEFGVSKTVAAYGDVVPEAVGDALLVGDPTRTLQEHPDAHDELALGNLWYASNIDVVGTYTVLPHRAFTQDTCSSQKGGSCDDLWRKLFRVDLSTGERLVDLMAVNSIVLVRSDRYDTPPSAPEGWSLVSEGRYRFIYVRDSLMDPAGGVAWHSPGVVLEQLSVTDTEVQFRVESVPETDAKVVFSRLDWPGYTLSAGALAESTRGWLLTADLQGVEPGETVTLSFRPPGFWIEALSALLAALLTVVLLRQQWRTRGLRAGDDALSSADRHAV